MALYPLCCWRCCHGHSQNFCWKYMEKRTWPISLERTKQTWPNTSILHQAMKALFVIKCEWTSFYPVLYKLEKQYICKYVMFHYKKCSQNVCVIVWTLTHLLATHSGQWDWVARLHGYRRLQYIQDLCRSLFLSLHLSLIHI